MCTRKRTNETNTNKETNRTKNVNKIDDGKTYEVRTKAKTAIKGNGGMSF